jgi:hypothetical protein
MSVPEWDRTRRDLPPVDPADEVVEERVADPEYRRVRVVRSVCAAINIICGLFAIVLATHIILVLFEANPNNGFASLVDSWSSAVSLGLRGLFTPESEKLRVLLNDGLAAIAWLVIAGLLTYAIRHFALPGPGHAVRYRRVLR